MSKQAIILSNLLGAVGAAVGGTIGFWLTGWIATRGYYGMMIPGGLLGFGCGLLAQHRSEIRGVSSGLAALVLGLYTEWWNFPFTKDRSLDYFIRHLSDVEPIHLVLILIGAVIACYLARTPGRIRPPVDAD